MVNANGGLSGARSVEAAVKQLQKSKMKTGTRLSRGRGLRLREQVRDALWEG